MRLQICRLTYDDAGDMGAEDVVSLRQAARMVGVKWWALRQLVDEGELTMLLDADAPKGWAWRWLLLRSEVEALAESQAPAAREGGRGIPQRRGRE